MKLERADSCESSGMNFLEYQNFFHGENEKSPRANNSGPRVTTHNSACALKGLNTRKSGFTLSSCFNI
jgi:hypothetical protein